MSEWVELDRFGVNSNELADDPKAYGIRAQIFTEAINQLRAEVQTGARSSGVQLSPQEENQILANLVPNIKSQIRQGATQNSIKTELVPYALQGVISLDTQRKINPVAKEAHTRDAARIIQETYGRPATPDEVAFFSQEIAKGESPYEIAQFLQSTPEFTKKQADTENLRVKEEATAARNELSAAYDNDVAQAVKRIQPEIMSAYMRAGRFNSSGFDSALAREVAKIQQEKSSRIAGLAYEDAVRAQGYKRDDFVGANRNAFSEFIRRSDPGLQRQSGLQGYYDQIPLSYASDRVARTRELDNYERQQNDFFRALSDQLRQSREASLYGLGGAALGAGITGITMGMGGR